jgi:hypothetical protein
MAPAIGSNQQNHPGHAASACPGTDAAAAANRAQDLVALVSASAELVTALKMVRSLGLRSWCIGAGAIRSLVWDKLHGFTSRPALDDVDVVYFDATRSATGEAELEIKLRTAMPTLRWEVTNQATVHQWFASALGQHVPPLRSLEEGVATWPEYATCVGVYLNPDDSIGIVAPHGLDDLFELRVRHNPVRASAAAYRQRVQSKQFGERWPKLRISRA